MMCHEPASLIHHYLENSARKFPDKVALVHEETRATYRQINDRANRLSNWLISQGIVSGDRVAILLENGLEYVVSYYATLKAGAVAVPLSTGLGPDGLKGIIEEITPNCMVLGTRFERVLKAAAIPAGHCNCFIIHSSKKLPEINDSSIFRLEDIIDAKHATNPDLPIGSEQLASIIYTSGSTGKPKGVMLSHGNIVANTRSICSYLALTPDDIQMVVLPFFYVMGKSLLNTHFAVGGTVVVNNKFAFPASVLNQLVTEQVTGFSGVPSTYAFLLHRSPLKKYRDKLTSLRYCSQAGGHMSQSIKSELRETLPEHTDIFIMYGATEASARLTYLDPKYFDSKKDSIGQPIPGVKLKLAGINSGRTGSNEKGELVASGANIMQGYWKDEKATARVLKNGGYHTGDLAYQDSDGFYYVIGRDDNQIKSGGHRINPQEIEDHIMDTGLVVEVAVMGIPDPLLGLKLAAVVAPKNKKITSADILKKCASNLPKHKLPAQIAFARALPKKASGKIDREKCLDIAKQTLSAEAEGLGVKDSRGQVMGLVKVFLEPLDPLGYKN
jgi:long-chain acyl-CoA synthetase